MKVNVFRAHIDDVERLSYGKGAKRQRGTGSKYVCHRLNQQERSSYERAKQAGYVVMKSNGYRRERKGSPLGNLWRQRADALSCICVCIHQQSDLDRVMVDFSTLRVSNDNEAIHLVRQCIQTKYPDIYANLMQYEVEQDTPNPTRMSSKPTSLTTPIDWESVKTKPIWQVNERLLTVPCDRSFSKAVASDVIEVMKSFHYIEEKKSVTLECDKDSSTMNIASDECKGSEDDDVIDFDDI